MPRFRPLLDAPLPGPVDPDTVRTLLADVIRPCHFFVGGQQVEWSHHPAEDRPWEVFQGRLLDPAHTRQMRTFETWKVSISGANVPLLALYFDSEVGEVHVVRGLLCHVYEGYDAGGGVILDREVCRWVAELVGSVDLSVFDGLEQLRDTLIEHLFHAVAGSRLPLTSVEAPLPGFSFGELAYCYRADTPGPGPMRSWRELWDAGVGLGVQEVAKWLEEVIRAVPPEELGDLAGRLSSWAEGQGADLGDLGRTLFNLISLSPWTDFADKFLLLLGLLEERGTWRRDDRLDLLTWLLRQLGRHLTGYDLVTFHHRGANYPDALLLDAVLGHLMGLLAEDSRPFIHEGDGGLAARLRRRGVRQGWLLRRQYQGHAVPDLPTSPGENARVLPASHPRVPEEQILNPIRRGRRLFTEPLLPEPGSPAWTVLRAGALDLLRHPVERRELGAALFLDRPLGGGKQPAEPDGTLLLTGVAFSRSVAERRIRYLEQAGLLTAEEARQVAEGLDVAGLPLERIGGPVRPGTVSLADAARAAPDFVYLNTTRSSLRDLRAAFDWSVLPDAAELLERVNLVTRSSDGPGLTLWDEHREPVLEVEPRLGAGYVRVAGQEVPAGGLWVVRVGGEEVRSRGLVVRPVRD